MRSTIRLSGGEPYVELSYAHRHAASAAEDALEHFFDKLEVTKEGNEPMIPMATYTGRKAGDKSPTVSGLTIRLVPASEFFKMVEEEKLRLQERRDQDTKLGDECRPERRPEKFRRRM